MIMESENSSGLTLGKLAMGIVLAVVGLWVLFNIILPTIFFAVKIVITLAVFGVVMWIVYKAVTFDPDKSL